MAYQARFHVIRRKYNSLNIAMGESEIPQGSQAVTTLFTRIRERIDHREKRDIGQRLFKAFELTEEVQSIMAEHRHRKKMLQPNGTHCAIFDDSDMSWCIGFFHSSYSP